MTLNEYLSQAFASSFQNTFRKKGTSETNFCDSFSNSSDPNALRTKFELGEENTKITVNQVPLSLSGNVNVEENGLSAKAFTINNHRLNSQGVSFTDEESSTYHCELSLTLNLSAQAFEFVDTILDDLNGWDNSSYIRSMSDTDYEVEIPFTSNNLGGLSKNSILAATIKSVSYNDSLDQSIVNLIDRNIQSIDESERTIFYNLDLDTDKKVYGNMYGCNKDENGFNPTAFELYIPIVTNFKADIGLDSAKKFCLNCFKDFEYDGKKFFFDTDEYYGNFYSDKNLFLVIYFNKESKSLSITIKTFSEPSYYDAYPFAEYYESNANEDLSQHENISITCNTSMYSTLISMEYHTERLMFNSNKDSQLIVKGDVVHKEKEYEPFINAVNKSKNLLDYFEVTEDTITPLIDKVLNH